MKTKTMIVSSLLLEVIACILFISFVIINITLNYLSIPICIISLSLLTISLIMNYMIHKEYGKTTHRKFRNLFTGFFTGGLAISFYSFESLFNEPTIFRILLFVFLIAAIAICLFFSCIDEFIFLESLYKDS